jgi:hypothetical protein
MFSFDKIRPARAFQRRIALFSGRESNVGIPTFGPLGLFSLVGAGVSGVIYERLTFVPFACARKVSFLNILHGFPGDI